MSTEVISRPPRRAAPPLPAGEIALEPPPAIPRAAGARWQQWLSVLPMLLGTAATAMMFGGRSGGGAYTYVVGGVFGLSTLGMLVLNLGGANGPRKSELMQARRDYLRYLSGVRSRVRSAIDEQRRALEHRHPEPQVLWSEAIGPRVWERRPGDADFAVVRVGVGPQSLAASLVAPIIDPNADLEPVTASALRRFLDAYSVVPDLPVSLALRSFARVRLTGDASPDDARGFARALVAQLATFHAPDDLVIAACVTPQRRAEWDWLKWLPHALHPTAVDAAGPCRLVVDSLVELDELLGPLVARRPRFAPASIASTRALDEAPVAPHIVVIVDGIATDGEPGGHVGVEGGLAGVTLLEFGRRPAGGDRSTLGLIVGADGSLRSVTADAESAVGRADALGPAGAESLARRLARLRLSASNREAAPLSADHDLAGLLGLGDLRATDPATLWTARTDRDLLRIPIGTGPTGTRVDLDIKEAAQGGMGPHGLIVGATGSGKSELLRTLVLGLAATHSSDVLNVVLVDFKGGATFGGLDRLPHTSAVITNLGEDLALVDRMNDALSGELNRRQELLKAAGNLTSVREYAKVRAGRADLAPLPALLVVCDEFTELLTAKPEFIDLFVQIGRLGRSLGVHLLLATQRLEEGRLRGLESHLSYKIALRTFTSGESRIALGVPDAAELPATPGHGFLRVGTEPLRRFKAAYVSGPYRPISNGRAAAAGIQAYTTRHQPVEVAEAPAADADAPTLMEVVVSGLAGRGAPAHRAWLPPLETPPNLDELLGADPLRQTPPDAEPTVRLGAPGGAAGGGRPPSAGPSNGPGLRAAGLRVPIALIDRPYEQRRDVGWLDLSGAAGHVAIVGGPQSGKSTATRALVASLALTHTPREVQVYCLDFGGGSLTALRGLPHVGAVAGRLDADLVRRTVGEVATLLVDRERRFAARGIDSMASFRRLRRIREPDATVAVAEDGFGDVFLVVDGWSTLRGDFEDLEPVVVDLATRGLSYGIHVVATASRWSDFRSASRDLFGSRIELRLGDPTDSAVNRRHAANVPSNRPGRGLWADGLHLLVAQPATNAYPPAALVAAIAAAWTGSKAPAVRMLPPSLPYESLLRVDVPVPLGEGLAIPLGIAEANLRPVFAEFGSDPHLIAFGDSECGKSTLLRGIAESITRRFTPEQARIVLVDYRRSLLGAITTEHLIGYGTSAETTEPLIVSVAGYLEKRRPGPDVTPQQLRDRSWWSGPECFVLIDDYDLVTTGANPVVALLEYLAQARDVGLHVVITRRAGGAARALYEPVLQRLRELGTPGIVMSGEREEGALVGTVRPGPQPPGRGWLVTRKEGARLVQLANLAP